MKHKVAELEGPLLDAAVAKAEDVILVWENFESLDYSAINEIDGRNYRPSVDWRIGGKIVERERIDISAPEEWSDDKRWYAGMYQGKDAQHSHMKHEARGPTPLIAAMRAYVSIRFGEEVELP